ncbi:DUF1538 domain-containing protein [Desulfoprunum benzoelyticum]|uniref:DUF1538 domain-containing protein n=1 Tax=Desulfoprunum benzoelyticum TaxID=1506996 RepID=A0A840ULL4_9BACT|nr:DUF1538 domain-containing protein [Desulfoprunum benzoelyticum]MBB5346662.1 hypothetical protein [Desulfoprunum benzoelyticum]MBM9529093.1 DUF1538 domain-containing protein [Desulfoprunum benzoelyticum]
MKKSALSVYAVAYVLKKIWSACADLLPIVVVIAFFQFVIIRKPLPDVGEILLGTGLVVVGLSMFIEGLERALFPIGEEMAYSLTRKGSLFWLLIFSFALGFSTTVAEPALIAVSNEAANIAIDGGLLENSDRARNSYSLGLRLTVAFSVGFSILLGVLRILRNWPLHYLIIGGYCIVMLMTLFAPQEIIGIAYDAGGVTTSTITVPLVTALGVGLATIIKGRNPLIDGFGLIAFASLLPMIFVMGYGLVVF